MLCITCFAAGLLLGQNPPQFHGSKVRFREPLIEQAVRLALQKDASEAITEADLLNISQLRIYGNQPVDTEEEYQTIGNQYGENQSSIQNGGIQNLEDLSQLKNLRVLYLAHQEIRDLTPISTLEKLNNLDLRHNPVEDATPLSSLRSLQKLTLYDTLVTDLRALSSCPVLDTIDIGQSQIFSLDKLQGLRRLQYLRINNTPLRSLAGVEEFQSLKIITFSMLEDEDLSPLLNLPLLKEAQLGEAQRALAATTLENATFKITLP